MLLGDMLQIWSPNASKVDQILLEVKTKLGSTIVDERSTISDAQFGDVTIDAMVFPTYGKATPEYIDKSKERAQHYFEETWAHRSLTSLAGNTPIDAAGHPILRRKLLGDILFLEQNFSGNAPRNSKDGKVVREPLYDFERLRHKLGLDSAPPPLPIDFGAMSASDLAGLDVNALSIEQLENAHQAALTLDAGELANKFIRTIIERPVDGGRADLFPFFKQLIDQGQSRADWEAALRLADEGLKADAQRNGGMRQGDYEIRRAQLLAKKGDAEKSAEAFEAIIARVPGELKYRGTAAEAMLSLRQGKLRTAICGIRPDRSTEAGQPRRRSIFAGAGCRREKARRVTAWRAVCISPSCGAKHQLRISNHFFGNNSSRGIISTVPSVIGANRDSAPNSIGAAAGAAGSVARVGNACPT